MWAQLINLVLLFITEALILPLINIFRIAISSIFVEPIYTETISFSFLLIFKMILFTDEWSRYTPNTAIE